MEQKTLEAMIRNETKKGAAGRLRRSGRIPAVIYGHAGSANISVDEREFHKKFATVSENTIINLRTDEKTYDVLVKQFQEDILSGKVLHIDFYEIEAGKVLRTNVPVRLVGTPVGVREGGILEQVTHEVEVECLPKDIPEEFVVNVDELDTGNSFHIGDIETSDEIKILSNEDTVVAMISHIREEVEEVAEEELEEGMEIEGEEGEETEGADEDSEDEE